MSSNFFESLFCNSTTPTVVCKADSAYSTICTNKAARLLLQPDCSPETAPPLRELLAANEAECAALHKLLGQTDSIEQQLMTINKNTNEQLQINLAASRILFEQENYWVLYLTPLDKGRQSPYTVDVLQTIVDNADGIVYASDIITHEVLFVNKLLYSTLGSNPADLLGKPCWSVMQKGMSGPCPFCPLPQMLHPDGSIKRREYNWEFQNTVTEQWYLVHDSIVTWTDGRDVHIETATEITNQKEYEQALEYVASTDAMTGLFNRERGAQIISHILANENDQYASLVFLDLDGLKQVNDSLGHDQGDKMILKTVSLIKSCVRKSDVLCRWGGDEFVLILRGKLDDAAIVMRNIQEKMHKVNESGENAFRLSFSYGIKELQSGSGQSLDDALLEADRLMYKNKLQRQKEQFCN